MTEPTTGDASIPTVVEAFSRVQADILAIEKRETNKDQGFVFRGIDAVVDKVGPVLRTHNVIIIPDAEEITTERYISRGGAHMQGAIVRMRYTVHGPAGDSFSGSTYGQAADSGDKAVSKAQSVAYRVFLLQGLTIPTHDPDPDANSHERAGVQQEVKAARAELGALIDELDWATHDDAMDRFAADNNGRPIQRCHDPAPIRVLIEHYRAERDRRATDATSDS